MWWYKDRAKREPAPREDLRRRRPPEPPAQLVDALRAMLAGRGESLDLMLAVAVLEGSRLEFEDGTVLEGVDPLAAELALSAALSRAEPLRLYNRYARDFGEGYAARTDLPAEHAQRLAALRASLSGHPGVRSVAPRG